MILIGQEILCLPYAGFFFFLQPPLVTKVTTNKKNRLKVPKNAYEYFLAQVPRRISKVARIAGSTF